MEKETQISVLVSLTTKELLERHVRATGVKKGLKQAETGKPTKALRDLMRDRA